MSYFKPISTNTLAKNKAMAGSIDIAQREKEIASNAVKILRGAVRSAVANTSHSRTGEALKIAGAESRFKGGRLQRLAIKAPYYTFMQNYGFEGQKSNGVNMRLNATDVFMQALDSSNVLETLADEISEIRIDQVIALINLK